MDWVLIPVARGCCCPDLSKAFSTTQACCAGVGAPRRTVATQEVQPACPSPQPSPSPTHCLPHGSATTCCPRSPTAGTSALHSKSSSLSSPLLPQEPGQSTGPHGPRKARTQQGTGDRLSPSPSRWSGFSRHTEPGGCAERRGVWRGLHWLRYGAVPRSAASQPQETQGSQRGI